MEPGLIQGFDGIVVVQQEVQADEAFAFAQGVGADIGLVMAEMSFAPRILALQLMDSRVLYRK